jgi:predicted dehydrogenase
VQPSRRDVLQTSAGLAVASTLAGLTIPHVHAAGDETVRIALVGCGGRGTGAAGDAMNTTLQTKLGPTKLVAMADVFEDRIEESHRHLSRDPYTKLVDVPKEKRFVSFDGYKQAMDCLKPGDLVILATPPAFRWVHFSYAVTKGLNVFMEKPVTVDGPTSRRMLELNEEAKKKDLKVAVGLMCRHCKARGELHKRIKDGQIGDVTLLRAYRVAGPTGHAFVKPNKTKYSDLMYQIRNFHGFLWASGGAFSDFLIHNIDESCWMKDAWPVEAKAYGGRHYRDGCIDQNFDSYTVEYTFDDGAKLMLEGRCMEGCDQEFASYAHGTKGSAIISTSGHFPARVRMFKDQNMSRQARPTWAFPPKDEAPYPYQIEWNDLITAIRANKPYNELQRGVEASLVTSMGRLAAHTGKKITYKQMLEHEHEFAPGLEKLTLESPAPLPARADGTYPVPMPGKSTKREYEA